MVQKRLTHKEYLQLEEQEGIRYEYYDGVVEAMAGVSLNHNRITSNVNRTLGYLLENTPYEVFQEAVKLVHTKSNSFLYPDIIVICDEEDTASTYLIKKPVLLVEVLSSSTEGKDRGKKLAVYCAIPTLRYYILINQNIPYIEVYSREKTLAVFQYRMFQEMSSIIDFTELDFQISLEQIYRSVRFGNSVE